jgi:hypothetical protein
MIIHFFEVGNGILCSNKKDGEYSVNRPEKAGLISCQDCIKIFNDSYLSVGFGSIGEQRSNGVIKTTVDAVEGKEEIRNPYEGRSKNLNKNPSRRWAMY